MSPSSDSKTPTETVEGDIGCACSIDEDPRPTLMLIRTDRPVEGCWPQVEYGLSDFLIDLFAEHAGEWVEIRFYKEQPRRSQ